MFDRVHKDWFDVCLCLWIVKTIMPPESGHDPLGRRSFFLFSGFLCLLYLQLWDVSMSSHDVSFLWDVSDEIWGRIFSSCYDPVLPPAMQWQCPKQDEAYRSKSGEEYEWCVHSFRSAASWWLCQLLPAWLAVWLRCCLRSRKQPPLFPLSSTCRNRPIGQCSTLPWRCRGVFFSGLFCHFRSVFLRFSGLTHPLFLFCQEFLYGWVHLDVPSVRYGRGYDWIRIFILWATSQLLWVQLLLLVIVFHA